MRLPARRRRRHPENGLCGPLRASAWPVANYPHASLADAARVDDTGGHPEVFRDDWRQLRRQFTGDALETLRHARLAEIERLQRVLDSQMAARLPAATVKEYRRRLTVLEGGTR